MSRFSLPSLILFLVFALGTLSTTIPPVNALHARDVEDHTSVTRDLVKLLLPDIQTLIESSCTNQEAMAKEWLLCFLYRELDERCKKSPGTEGCDEIEPEMNERCMVEVLVRSYCGFDPVHFLEM